MAMKRPADPRGGHVRLYWNLLDSMAWRALDYSAIALYMAMRRKLGATNNGNIEATIATLRHAGFKSPTTLAKGLRALEAVGLIERTRQGGVARGQRVCNLFRFTDEVTFALPNKAIPASKATNEWQKFERLADAEKAIADAHAEVLGSRKNRLGNQNLYRTSTDTVLKPENSDTDSVLGAIALEQKLFPARRQKSPKNRS